MEDLKRNLSHKQRAKLMLKFIKGESLIWHFNEYLEKKGIDPDGF